jgi:hypothetical protein
MTGSKDNRATRRSKGRVRKAAFAGATAAAMTVGLAAAPAAQAYDTIVDRDFTWDPVYGSGLVVGLLDFVSRVAPGQDFQLSDTISFQTGPPPSLGLNISTALSIPVQVTTVNAAVNVGLNLNIRQIAGDTKNLYNTEAGIAQPGCNQSYGISLSGPKGYASTCRYAIQLATLGAVGNLIDAFRAQIASVQGDTAAGLIPFTFGPNATATFSGNVPGANGPAYTNQALIFLQNQLRPNGGIGARFPGITSLLGGDPAMPAGGKTVSPDGKIVLNTTTLDLTWAYDPIGDFPAVFNLTSMANSLLAALPLNIVTGGLAAAPLQGSSLSDIGLNLAGLLQLPIDFSATIGITATLNTLAMEDGKSFYSTLVPNELPITTAIGLPGTLVNFVLNTLGSRFLLGNPVGDALAPAMKILVNTGYTDVLAPDDLSECATGCGTADAKTWAQLGYTAYDRTFGAYAAPGGVASAATPTPFGSVDPLTPAEKRAAFGDVWEAFFGGLAAQFAKPLWGIIVPADSQEATPSAAVKTAAAVKPAATVPVEIPAAPVSAPVSVQTAAEPAATPQSVVFAPEPTAPKPTAPVTAPADAPAQVADPASVAVSAPVEDPAPVETPRGARGRTSGDAAAPGTHRGRASSSSSENSEAPSSAPRQRASR